MTTPTITAMTAEFQRLRQFHTCPASRRQRSRKIGRRRGRFRYRRAGGGFVTADGAAEWCADIGVDLVIASSAIVVPST